MATAVRHDAIEDNISFALSDCYAKAEALARKIHSEAKQITESYVSAVVCGENTFLWGTVCYISKVLWVVGNSSS
ncbi:UNVERIFIED_CONTAM: hypothetical protein FKN15_031167 [Acipenser sinensis]